MSTGDTSLHYAIRLKNDDIAEAIIPKFADFKKSKNKSKGYTALH
jgi:ankyrin repeat protein